MSCSPCYVGGCITAPNNCALGAPGGWQKLWFFNRCDIASYQFESLNGNPRGRISGITLAPNAQAYSFAYYKRTGLQFDSEAIDENGFRWTHTVAIPVINRDAETTALLEQMIGAELVFVGLHRDGRYYLAGVGQEGFQLSNWNDTKGRVAADGAVMELRFSLTDIYPQKEVLLDDGNTADSDIQARLALTDSFFTNVDCGGSSPGEPSSEYLSVPFPTFQLFPTDVGTFSTQVNIDRNLCSDELTVMEGSSTLPVALTGGAPPTVDSTADAFQVTLSANGAQTPGNYTFGVQVSGTSCPATTLTFGVEVIGE